MMTISQKFPEGLKLLLFTPSFDNYGVTVAPVALKEMGMHLGKLLCQ